MGKDSKLTVSLILNDASFSKRLAAVNRELKLTESEFKQTASTTKNFGSTLDGAKAKFEQLSSKLDASNKKISLYKDEIKKTDTTLNSLTTTYNENDKNLSKLNEQYVKACMTMGENSEEAKGLDKEIKSLEKSQTSLETKIISTSTRLDTLNTSLNLSQAEFNELQRELSESSTALENFQTEKAKQRIEEMSKSIQNVGDKFEKTGKTISEVGGNLTKYVTAPIIGIGTAATAVSMKFEASMSNVQALSGAVGEDFDKLSDKAREMGAKTSKSASEAADAMGYMALAGWDVSEMLAGIEPILRLSEAGNMDLAKASDLVTDSMGGLKLAVNDVPRYLDQVAQTSRKSNTSIQQLMEAFINTGATATNLGIPLEETSALLGILANNGNKGYEAGTKLNSIITRMTAQSGPAREAWSELGISVYDAEGKFRGMTTVLSETKEKFQELTNEEQQYFLKRAVGTDNITAFNNLMNASGGEIQALTATIRDSSGAMEEMAVTMQDNLKGKITQLKSKLEELGIKLGETLVPMFTKLAEKLSELVDKFNALSPETQEAIVKFGLIAAATGPVVKGLGGVVSASGSMIKLGGKLVGMLSGTASATAAVAGSTTAAVGTAAAGTGLAGLGSALGGVALAAAPYVAAGAAIVGTGYAIHKGLSQEVIPTVDLFADKVTQTSAAVYDSNGVMIKSAQYTSTAISEETKKAVSSYLELDENVRNTMTSLYANSVPITNEIASNISTKFSEMGTMIRDSLSQNSQDSINILSGFFETSNVMTSEYEAGIIAKQTAHYEEKMKKIQGYEERINSIVQGALNENRELREDELNKILEFEDKMREESIKSRSQTEEEASLILGRLASYDKRITAEMASEHIKEAERMRIEAVDAATKEYNDRVAQIEYMRDESKVISKEQADALIKDAERQRDDAVKHAADMKENVVKKISEMNKDVLDDVDTQTGKIMTKWDKVKNWWNNLSFNKKSMEVDMIENRITNYRSTGRPNEPQPRLLDLQPQPFTDSLEVANRSSYAADTVKSITAVSNSKNADASDILAVMQQSLNETIRQNKFLMELVKIMQLEKDVNVELNVDGRQIAKATAQYMSKEIDNINVRKNRLGGVF